MHIPCALIALNGTRSAPTTLLKPSPILTGSANICNQQSPIQA